MTDIHCKHDNLVIQTSKYNFFRVQANIGLHFLVNTFIHIN